ncbi:MAG: OmpA family protein, partial [Vicinamibacterales bacterium]
LALVIQGEAPEALRRKQQDVLEHIHLQYAGALSDFSGDAAPFQSAHEDLGECLETVVDTGDNRRGRLWWMRWAIPAAVVVLAVLVTTWRSNARFGRAVAALNGEPGLVVIDAQRGWSDWRISGLRDPQARTPRAVLAGLGLVPRSLSGRWESYLSLDSTVVISRVRQAWGLLASTRLSLRGDMLTVAGDVPLSSLRLSQTDLPPGIAGVELEDTRVILPPDLDSIQASLVADRVLFDPGESDVFGSGRAQILSAAARFRALDDSVTANAGEVTLTLNGRTDPTGTNETNRALAQWRVDHVAAIFASAGVRTKRLRAEALATTRPLTAPDSVEQARINRSVSFEIDVLARPRVPREPR